MTSGKNIAPVVRVVPVWKIAYADTETGHWITDDGREQKLGVFPSLAVILAAALREDVRMVYLTGSVPGVEEDRGSQGSFERWALADTVTTEWKDEGTHFGDVQRATSQAVENPVIRKRHNASGARVSLYRASNWFGDKAVTPHTMRETMQALAEMLSAKWKGPVMLQSTPKQTGLRLWQQWLSSIGKSPGDYPPLPQETQGLIRGNAGQGRRELCTLPELEQISGLYCLDARFMYAASLNNLPSGALLHDDVPEFLPNIRGRYRVRYRVPAQWQHLGLLMTKAEPQGWKYPCVPGETGEAWAGWTEVQLAKNNGWEVEIYERLLWSETGQKGGPTDPLKTWGSRLTECYMAADALPLVKTALRNIVLATIGSFAPKPRVRRVIGSINDAAFLEAMEKARGAVKKTPSGNYTCEITEEPKPGEALFSHPEWSAEIWARCRTRMLHYEQKRAGAVVAAWGALHVPRSHVVAIQTDALYLSHLPDWPDDGLPGSMRVKPPSITHPVTAPRSYEQLRSLRSQEAQQANAD